MKDAKYGATAAAVKELTQFIRTKVPSLQDQHDMINLLTVLAGALYMLRSDLEDATDALVETLENKGK